MTWCERCKRDHNCPPVDENKVISDHADAIARAIDREIIEQFERKHPSDVRKNNENLHDYVSNLARRMHRRTS